MLKVDDLWDPLQPKLFNDSIVQLKGRGGLVFSNIFVCKLFSDNRFWSEWGTDYCRLMRHSSDTLRLLPKEANWHSNVGKRKTCWDMRREDTSWEKGEKENIDDFSALPLSQLHNYHCPAYADCFSGIWASLLVYRYCGGILHRHNFSGGCRLS